MFSQVSVRPQFGTQISGPRSLLGVPQSLVPCRFRGVRKSLIPGPFHDITRQDSNTSSPQETGRPDAYCGYAGGLSYSLFYVWCLITSFEKLKRAISGELIFPSK